MTEPLSNDTGERLVELLEELRDKLGHVLEALEKGHPTVDRLVTIAEELLAREELSGQTTRPASPDEGRLRFVSRARARREG